MKLKNWLDANEVKYDYVGIEEDADAAAYLESQTGKKAIPFLHINKDKWVRGYHTEAAGRFDPNLLISEVQSAAGG